MPRPPRTLALLSIALAALAAGCAGVAANPSRFPYWLPTGDVVPTHAKPAGRGYFADFDPDAVKLELSPDRGNARVGEERVFVATVLDAEGNARRKRRVEWILDGPGYIVETDESGITAGRGYLVNNQRAVSYTNHFAHTFDRGTSDPGDDFSVESGQTWCVVSSAKPGETTLTAYAPEIQKVSCRTAIARVVWGDAGQAGKPPTATPTALAGDLPAGPARNEFTPVGRASGEPMTLDIRAPRVAKAAESFLAAVELANPGKSESAAANVTLTLPAGAEASDFSFKPDSQDGDRYSWSFQRIPPDARRDVKFKLRAPRPGEITLNAEAKATDGARATQTAKVKIGTTQLEVSGRAPERRPVGEAVRVPVTVVNSGTLPADNVSVFATLPKGENPGGKPVELRFGSVPAGGRRTETFDFTPDREGTWRVALDATAGDGESARGEVAGEATVAETFREPAPAAVTSLPPPPLPPPPKGRPSVEVEWVRAPTMLGKGKVVRGVVAVTNRGTAPAENVELTVGGDGVETRRGDGPRGLTGRGVGNKLLFPALTTLDPGETVEFTVDLAGGAVGPGRIDASVTAKHQSLPLREERSVRVANE